MKKIILLTLLALITQRLLEAGKVTRVTNKEYKLSQHYVYRSEVPIKLCRG